MITATVPITITDADLATIANEIESGWPYTRAPRLFDLDYAIAASAAIQGRESDLDVWHEIAGWTFDVMIGYWLLSQEHQNEAYVIEIERKLIEAQFGPGEGLRGIVKSGEMPDQEDFEGALEVLRVARFLQGDREVPDFEDGD